MMMMKRSRVFAFISLVFSFACMPCFGQDAKISFNRKEFYSVMASQKMNLVEGELDLLKKINSAQLGAYDGALLMKKAGLAKGPAKKLNLFKQGHRLLEAAISEEPANAEWKFLRLMIQEHAPRILGYKDDLEKDSTYIRQSFKKMPADVQRAIIDYTKTSKLLRSEDF